MRTAIIILGGLLLLAICVGIAHLSGGAAAKSRAIYVFAVLWFIAAGVNMSIGVVSAGYSFMEELPIFLVIFLVPVGMGFLLRWKWF